MHGIVHKTLKEYISEITDPNTWTTIVDRANIEPKLYLPVSHYDDAEIDALLSVFAETRDQHRELIERDFGRRLAPALVSTFDAHLRDQWGLFELLENMEMVTKSVDETTTGTTVPEVTCERTDSGAIVTYRSQRDYCELAYGILEGLGETYDTDVSVTKETCIHDGDDACTYSVDRL